MRLADRLTNRGQRSALPEQAQLPGEKVWKTLLSSSSHLWWVWVELTDLPFRCARLHLCKEDNLPLGELSALANGLTRWYFPTSRVLSLILAVTSFCINWTLAPLESDPSVGKVVIRVTKICLISMPPSLLSC